MKELGVEDAMTDPLIALHNVKDAVIARSDWGEGGLAHEIATDGAAGWSIAVSTRY